jgi:hypothetical protein
MKKIEPILIITGIFIFLDFLTTVIGIQKDNLAEANPFIENVVLNTPLFFVIKLCTWLIVVGMYKIVVKCFPIMRLYMTILYSIFDFCLFIVLINNFILIFSF